jgi:hypothetical protein
MRRISMSTVVLALAVSTGVTWAQSVPAPQNPLRPGNARTAAPPAQQATPAPTTEAPKPKRQRSEAQLANDNRMRACGAEWRANKAALSAQGKTWRVFNVECRARMKAQGR